MFFLNPSRRHFLQTAAAAIASWLLPRSLFAKNLDRSFHFIHADTLISWPVADPVVWALENRQEPTLERAAEGLANLTVDDGERVIRLVIRRCRLNLLELCPERVVVHYRTQHGLADLRPFFKKHGLARPQIEVVVRERKREIVTTQTGEDFLFGDRLAADFPIGLFLSKFASRFMNEADDGQPAPGTWSGFGWDGVGDNGIPWAALKSAWRRASPLICLNCDSPTILVNFGLPWSGMFNRTPKFVHVCGSCRRSFKDDSVKDVAEWMAANLDEAVWPDFDMVWDRRVQREAKS